MSTSQSGDSPARLTAFVGRSFLDIDKAVWHDLRDIFDTLTAVGFRYEDAKEAQLRPISTKVRELVERNEIYIGVLTKRYSVCPHASSLKDRFTYLLRSRLPTAWTTSEWVIEEIGYALGKDKRVLLLIEDGVSFPTTDLDGDTQWIKFRRDSVQASQSEISEMILGLIATRVVSLEQEATPVAAAPDSSAAPPEGHSRGEKFRIFQEHLEASRLSDAEKLQEEILSEETDPAEKKWISAFLTSFRATHGDAGALDTLKERVRAEPGDADAVESLARVHLSFKQYRLSADLLLRHLAHVSQERRVDLIVRASQALRKNGDIDEAMTLVLTNVRAQPDETPRRRSLVTELARAAADKKDVDLQAALLEKLLIERPGDTEERFKLAHAYGEVDRHKLSAHHYSLVTQHSDSPGANNNLALEYGYLGLKSTEIQELEKVAERNPLSKANLAGRYSENGFTKEAREIATTVLATATAAEDTLAINRARYVLDEASKMEKSDAEAASKISDETKAEREFMIAYADNYCAAPAAPFTGTYATRHGDITLSCTAGSLRGSGSYEKEEAVGALSYLYVLHGADHPPKPKIKKYTLSFDGKVEGRAGTFKLTISSKDAIPTLLGGDGSREITGLFMIENNTRTIRLLERDGSRTELSTATLR